MIDPTPSMWQSKLLMGVDGIQHGFSTRQGGVSDRPFDTLNLGFQTEDSPSRVATNRKLFFNAFDLNPDRVIVGEQVHGRKLAVVTKQDGGKGALDRLSAVPGVDALMTGDRGVGLLALFADCVPVFVASRRTSEKVIALAHAGWRGTVDGVVRSVVQSMAQRGIGPEDLIVALGPCIQRCCFEVSSDVADQFERVLGKDVVGDTEDGGLSVDLPLANKEWLVRSGVRPEMIEVSPLCTSCRGDLFFSHRRDAGHTGRMAALIVIK